MSTQTESFNLNRNFSKVSVAVRFSVLALLLMFCVGGASAASFNIVDDNGDGTVETSNSVFGTTPSGDISSNSEFDFNLGSDFEVGSISTSISSASSNSVSNLKIDVYIDSGGLDGNYNDGTKVKEDWSPSLSSGTLEFDLDSNYVLNSGNTYHISFYTESISCSGDYCVWNINSDDSSSSDTFSRSSNTFQTFTDITFNEANQAPQFNSTSVSPDPPLIGENVSYGAEVFDGDGSVSYTNLSLSYGGSTVLSDEQRSGTTSPVWNDVFTPQDGNKWLNATLEVVDDKGAVTTTEINRYLSDDNPEFNLIEPENITYTTPNIPYEINYLDDNDSKPNETGYCELYNDGGLVTNQTVYEQNATTLTGVANDVAAGSHTFEATCYENDDGQSTTKNVQYSNENGPPMINSFTASPATDWQKNEEISLSFDINDGFDNITYVNLTAERDGTEIANRETIYNTESVTDTISNFFEVSQIGNYTVELTAQDEQNQVSRQWINQSVPDTYPPTTTTNLTTNTFYKSPVYVHLNANDDESMIANLSYSVDGATYTTVQSSTATVEISGFGDHTLDFYAWDTAGNKEDVKSEIISLEELEANFFYNPSEPYTGETVTFDGGTAQGNITQYEWDFQSDGTYDATGETVDYVFNNPGLQDVTLRVTDDEGNTDTETQTLEVLYESENKSLVNSCPDSPFCRTNGSNPATISGSLDATDGNQTITYEVNATGADGSYDFFSFYNSTSSRLSTTGYSQILEVSIASNETNIPPNADFSVDLSGLTANTDASASSDQDGTITNYRWDWTNDGSYEDTGLTASHTYPSNGDYTINLQVEDNNGSVAETTKTVSVFEDTDDGDDGGGGTPPPDDEPENETEVSVDGSSATLLAPHSGARYSKSTFTVDESDDFGKTVTINGEEVTFEVNEVETSSNAEILLDGSLSDWSEEETREVRGIELTLVDAVKTESGGTISFTLSEPIDINEPVAWYAYNYTINQSGSVELQVRETGPNQDWNTVDTELVNSTTENQYINFTENIESGIYEARLRLNASDNSSVSNINGFYAGEVPGIDIFNPKEFEVFERPDTARKNVPLDYRFDVGDFSSVNGTGQYYVRNGVEYATIIERSVENVERENWFEILVSGDIEDIYSSSFSWFYPTEPDLYRVETIMEVGGDYGDYTGYVNATINDSTGAEKIIYSYGRNIEIVPTSWENYTEDNSESGVITESDSEVVDESYSVDQDGDGTQETVSVGTLKTTPDLPNENEQITLSDLSEGEIRFAFFSGNVNGTALMNRTFVLRSENGSSVYERRIAPGKTKFDFRLNGSQVGEWSAEQYDYYIEYFEPGTNDTLLYSSNETDDGTRTFTVQRAGLKDLASRIIDPMVDAFTSIYDVSSEYAGFIMAVLAVLGWYVASKVRGLDFLAKAGAVTIFGVAWWYGLIPGTVQAIVIGLIALTLVIKGLRGEITL